MRQEIAALIVSLLAVLPGCDSPLESAKKQAREKFAEQDADLLSAVPLEESEIQSGHRGSVAVTVDGGALYVMPPERKELNDRGTSLEYPKFHALVVKFAGGMELSTLPASWGPDDLAKLRFICNASGDMIDGATDAEELKEAVAILTARATIAPLGAFERLIWLEGEDFVGLLSGGFSESAWMEFCFRPANADRTNYLITFRRTDGGQHAHVLDFVRSLAFEPSANKTAHANPLPAPSRNPNENSNP